MTKTLGPANPVLFGRYLHTFSAPFSARCIYKSWYRSPLSAGQGPGGGIWADETFLNYQIMSMTRTEPLHVWGTQLSGGVYRRLQRHRRKNYRSLLLSLFLA
ncbi:hypothetical protein QCA50_018555 [Cerrena zonata]|uniref:Uncharacterized protein n=1 Tax=Cerrena zonata TaxID=2478898 RepID=A0AAW0FG48_9APHY